MSTQNDKLISHLYGKVHVIAFMVLLTLTCILLFQNCEPNSLVSSDNENPQRQRQQQQQQQQKEQTEEEEDDDDEVRSSPNSNKGSIVFINEQGNAIDPVNYFPINTNVNMQVIHADPLSNYFQWTIKKGFETIVNKATSSTATYKHRFVQPGIYNIFAKSYKTVDMNNLLGQFNKIVVIGETCSQTDILEIKLQSGAVNVGQSATFTIRDPLLFSSIRWRVTLPSQQVITSEAGTVTFNIPTTASVGSDLILEVKANPVESSESQCTVYRQKTLQVTEDTSPYFNPPLILDSDGQNAIMSLESNAIYKHDRLSSQYIAVDIAAADTCSFQKGSQIYPINCVNGRVDMFPTTTTDDDKRRSIEDPKQNFAPLYSISSRECQEFEIEVTAIKGDSSYQQAYYSYCPTDEDICFFGTAEDRPSHHTCQRGSVALNSENEPINGVCHNAVQNGCQKGQANDNAVVDTDTHYRWHCVGQHGGTTATNCQKFKAVHGACNNAVQNGCQKGQSNDNVIADTDTHYRWHCVGQHGGTTATNCQKLKAINGVCNNAVQNGCRAGQANDNALADTRTHYKWHCVGQHGGTTAINCQKIKPINGTCNNAVQNGCRVGQANDNAIADTNTHYRWQCVGQHGGTTAINCQKLKPSNGVCNNAVQNGCRAGQANDNAIADTNTHYRWHCAGLHGGTTAINCQKIKPVNGACNNTVQNGCRVGQADDSAIDDTSTHYRWKCLGQHGGTTAINCQKIKPVHGACNYLTLNCQSGKFVNAGFDRQNPNIKKWSCEGQRGGTTASCQWNTNNGRCDNTQRDRCLSGTAQRKPNANGFHKWDCVGRNGGTTDSNCQFSISEHGQCNNAITNDCQAGKLNDTHDTDTHYKWQCVGRNGQNAENCQKIKPVNGACNNAVQNGCRVGQANDNAIADTNTHYKWHCLGQHGGTTVTNCQKLKPINGACNNAVQNRCQTGLLKDVADSDTHYKWQCVGQHGGRAATDCQKAKPVNGACNNAVRNGCRTGQANSNAIADTNTHYKWHCVGQHGGTNVTTCQKLKPINGACNNAVRNRCQTGLLKDVADSDTHYKWQCIGQHGGTTVTTCQKLKPINGACNNAVQNRCQAGLLKDVADSDTHYKWQCVGQHGGRSATNCQKFKPVNGACNNAVQNGCRTGQANSNAIADSNTHYKWHCVGQHGGTTASNCQKLKPVNGACNNTVQNGCRTGQANSNAIADSSTHYKWQCVGQHGGTTATTCQKLKPINGACNNAIQNRCQTGLLKDVADSDTHYKWQCVGQHGGTTATNCQKLRPINGACNNAVQNGCRTGQANSNAIADTSVHYKWHCVGQHGGTTATNCQKSKPVNGACNNAVRNGCQAGQTRNIASTDTHYKWQCVGQHGGTTVTTCQKRKPINGTCNNAVQNGCRTGQANDNAIADTSVHYKWHCVGQHGGTTATNCQKSKPVNGACNNAVRNGCRSGSLKDVADTDMHYKWQCIGQHGGTTVTTCQKPKPVNGTCNNAVQNRCQRGLLKDVADTDMHYRWQCVGQHGGTTATNCQKLKPVNGACNNAVQNGCRTGQANSNAIADSNTHYKWHCVGQNGGTTASNCQKLKPVNGACNNAVRNGCRLGQANDNAIADTLTDYKWHCVGQHGGTTATNCQKPKPVNGACNNAIRNGCRVGQANSRNIASTDTHYQWQCIGQHGGTATTCQKRKPVNGACNNALQNGCQAGQANDNAIADTRTDYKWHCVGEHGGTTATNCQKAKPVNGACNNAVRNTCQSGSLKDVADTDMHYKWQCIGQHGGTTASNCQKRKPVNGACNNAVRNGCQSGSLKDVADTGMHYKWQCVGQHGGTTATNCQKRKPVNGACHNAVRNSCQSGSLKDAADTDMHYKWQCVGQYGGTTATNCQKAKPVNGACNNAVRNGCRVGQANDNAIADTDMHYKWQCVGQHGGTTASNCQKEKPVNGACNNAVRNGCRTGQANDNAIADTRTDYKWHCVGQHGGTTATNCQKRKPVNGACNNDVRNGCQAGQANDGAIEDTDMHYKWQCVGQHGGTTATNCQKHKPVNGACNNEVRNGCQSGQANDNAIADTRTDYKWHCVGEHGGTTATNCQKPKTINGVCNTAQKYACSAGRSNPNGHADTDDLFRWTCEGLNGGTNQSCQRNRPINGKCNTKPRGHGCRSGAIQDVTERDEFHRWKCVGQHGGSSVSCRRALICRLHIFRCIIWHDNRPNIPSEMPDGIPRG